MTDSVISRERRKATVWIVATWLLSTGFLAVALYFIITVSTSGNKWDRAIVVGVCGGLPVLQLEDGSTWLRVNSVRIFRVEDPNRLTCG